MSSERPICALKADDNVCVSQMASRSLPLERLLRISWISRKPGRFTTGNTSSRNPSQDRMTTLGGGTSRGSGDVRDPEQERRRSDEFYFRILPMHPQFGLICLLAHPWVVLALSLALSEATITEFDSMNSHHSLPTGDTGTEFEIPEWGLWLRDEYPRQHPVYCTILYWPNRKNK